MSIWQQRNDSMNMAIYSIRDLEKLTGVKAHTIRIWEHRYRLIEPARTDTNIRYYTDENLRHLFNIALLNRQGLKISRISKMRPEEVAARVSDISENYQETNAQIDALTLAMIDLDEAAFDRIFSTYAREHGFEQTMLQLIYPFLDKLNVLWLTGSVNPTHEKFISNLIRRKISCAIDKEGIETSKEASTFLLFLPENEHQELTLLFMHYILRTRRQRVVYLGIGASITDIRDASHLVNAHYVFTMLNEPPNKQSTRDYVHALANIAPNSKLLLSGAQFYMHPIQLPHNAQLLNGLGETLVFLEKLRLEASSETIESI